MISNSGTSTLGLYELKRQIDAFGGVDYFRPTLSGGYLPNARVMLANGDIVKNDTSGNLTNDPNTDMTGWVLVNSTNEVFDTFGNSQEDINKSLLLFAPLKDTNTWEQNRDIVQALNDYLYSTNGGGTIQLPAGTFLMKGVFLDSNIKIQMNEATVLEHPDSYDVHTFETRRYQTSGEISKDSFTLTVSSATNFKVGSLVAIRGAGGLSSVQSTKLVNAISNTDTTNLQLEITTGFSPSNTLVVDDEIIKYTSIAGDGTLGGVVRGALGTTATSHAINAPIGIAMRLVTEIIAISGNTITVLDSAKTSVSSANVFCGSQKVKVIGGAFKGEVQKEVIGWRWAPVAMKLHRFGELDYYAENCEAVFYAETSSDNKFNVRGKDIGKATYLGVTIGACGWLFQQCHRNEVNAKLIGDCWAGIYLDNRTSLGTEYDGACDENYGVVTCKYSNYQPSLTTTALLIIGGNGNQFKVLSENVHSVATIKASDQSYTYDNVLPTAQGNVVNISAKKAYRSIICEGGAIGNTLTISQQNVVEAPIIDEGNTVLATNAGGGKGNFTRFRNGDYIRPAISFLADPTLGFTRETDGSLRLYSAGVEICRWNSTGLSFPDSRAIVAAGANGLKIGTSASQKYGFFGVTPVVQPVIGNAATDPATTQTLVNNIRTALISLGLARAV